MISSSIPFNRKISNRILCNRKISNTFFFKRKISYKNTLFNRETRATALFNREISKGTTAPSSIKFKMIVEGAALLFMLVLFSII
jgi:hypothetical protein